MRNFLLFLFSFIFLAQATCNSPASNDIPSNVRLLIDMTNFDDVAYEIFVNSEKKCSISAYKFGYFIIRVLMQNTYQLEIKNGGYLFDAISFKPERDAEQMQEGWVNYEKVEYYLGIKINGGKLFFKD